MRLLRDRCQHCVCAAVPSCHPTTTQHSLEDVGKLWTDWGIHGLILGSFGIQVFLFFAAGLRKRSVSRILISLLWLAYLSADFVAIFILGHLSVHASGPRHQLLFLWAPLVLLHLGGQYTMTAFSMQDNELWRRHMLGLVNQVVVAGYVVYRSSWLDRRLLAAMALMFLSGCWRYAERTLCLYRASPARLKESALDSLSDHIEKVVTGPATGPKFITPSWGAKRSPQRIWSATLKEMLKADGRLSSFHIHTPERISSRASALVSETPLGDITDLDAPPSYILGTLQDFKSSKHRYRAYNYVGAQLVHVYQHLYTKAPQPLLSIPNRWFNSWEQTLLNNMYGGGCTYWCSYLIYPLLFLSHVLVLLLLVLFPFLLISATLVLFLAAKKSQLYSQADVLVSYILLIGAITLEVASLFIAYAPNWVRSAIWSVTKCIRPAKQWSEMLGQYNMIKSLTKKDASGIMSFVPQWISNHLDDKAIAHVPIYEDLKMFVLDKLLEFGTRKEDWNFARFHGQLALGKWKSSSSLPPNTQTALHKSINDVDFPTSVLIWHIATDILYLDDNTSNSTTNSGQQQHQMKKKMMMSRELSNYIMYLIFKCGVMLTNNTQLQHNNARKLMEFDLRLGEKDRMRKVFHEYKTEEDGMRKVFHKYKTEEDTMSGSERAIKIQYLKTVVEASQVAQELIDIHEEVNSWELIVAVWLEMLYYIAPRCGNAFHSEHLTTGGEFITHVLVLMQSLGPFLTLPYL